MKHLLFPLLLISHFSLLSQGIKHRIYLDQMFRETMLDRSEYTLELTALETPMYDGVIISKSGIPKARGGYLRVGKAFVEHGYFVFFYPKGELESEGNYDRGVKIGTWKRYAENGTSKPDRYYNPESADLVRQVMSSAPTVSK